jgi:hypothetical protein
VACRKKISTGEEESENHTHIYLGGLWHRMWWILALCPVPLSEKLQSPNRFDYFVHRLWRKVWEAAERETTFHRKRGTFSGPNSLGLLKLKTSAAIKALAQKIKDDGWDVLNHWEPDFSLALGG